MFDNEKLVSCGVMDKLSPEIQEKIWNELESRKTKNSALNHLQVFNITGFEIWVIDDGWATTMLLPEEY